MTGGAASDRSNSMSRTGGVIGNYENSTSPFVACANTAKVTVGTSKDSTWAYPFGQIKIVSVAN